MSLPNADINHLPPNGTFTGNDEVAIWNKVTGQTEKLSLLNLIGTDTADQNFEWVSTYPYLLNDVTTRGGNWYQALAGNTGVTPGTNPAIWSLITKSAVSGLTDWVAGVYTQAKVYVVSNHKGYIDIYRLFTGARPYNSTNIVTEEAAGIWTGIISPIVRSDLVYLITGSNVSLDMKRERQVIFYGLLTGNFTWSIPNNVNPYKISFKAIVQLTAGDVHTFPSNWKMSDVRKTGNNWVPLSTGIYLVNGIYEPTLDVWIVEINSEPYV